MAVNPSAFGPKPQFVDGNGNPAVGYKLFSYAAGSSTKQNTYTDSTGNTANSNPIVLNSLGQPTTEIWFTEGSSYKLVLAPANDTDPPGSPIWTVDNLLGINDASISIDQWIASGVTPTYVSGTSFTVPGDQTSNFQVNRRIKATVTAGTVYGYITNAVFGALTTVTVVIDSPGALDSGLSAVQLGLITPTNTSIRVTNAMLDDTIVDDQTSATPTLLDYLFGADQSDSNKNKKFISSAIRDLFYPAGHFTGFAPSTAGSSTTLTVGAGECKDSGNAAVIITASSIAKTTSAWAVGTGNGGLDTGAIANNTTYHWYTIRRPDTDVTDIIFSLSATSPTLPANYTQYRYLFPWRTNGSGQWVLMVYSASDDAFLLDTAVLDISATNPGTSSVTATLASLPTGIKVRALINAQGSDTSGAIIMYVRSLDQSDQAPSATVAPLGNSISQSASTAGSVSNMAVRTNTSAQIAYRIQSSAATTTVRIASLGFIYKMGSR
jgi:predicted pyridoxine 5'-phosphate oxidase superfamily flavin-nucleotide-binding protein